MPESRYERGMTVRRDVLGDTHVDRATSTVTEFDQRFQAMITEMAWGTVWADETLDRETRSLITIAILAALGREEELILHLRASQNIGVPVEKIPDVLHHVAIYAGVPAANSAFRLAKAELGITTKSGADSETGSEP